MSDTSSAAVVSASGVCAEVSDTSSGAGVCSSVELVSDTEVVSDTCSSEMYPPLVDRFRQFAPLAVLQRLEETDNVLSGTRASMIFEALTGDRVMAPLIQAPQLVEPWLWRMGKLTLLVYGVLFKRREN